MHAEIKKLIEQSQEAKTHAYCPHSKFHVGASLLTKDGKVFNGCNVDNVSHSMSICAERCAFFKAISEGHRDFKAIAVASDMADKFISPCGACRQVMYELGGKDLEVYLTKPDLSWKRTTMEELMPLPFDEFKVASK
ncbi:cytidine deaminase-like isoform X2 [Patiria miniata]|uniref:Cytidine deaminase n=1 Tax=Patiria miniata TaxID=46514 RepID=A0A914BK00_PATMI|nr:cytidine deaminase-like isoform X2 [Patiria miniata]